MTATYDTERKVERIEATVYGNGKGLTTRLGILEDRVEDFDGWMTDWQNTTNCDDYKEGRKDIKRIEKELIALKFEVKKLAIGLGMLMALLQYGGSIFDVFRAWAF